LLDEQIVKTVQQLHKHRRRFQFMKQFAEAPSLFLQELISSQVRDWKLMAAAAATQPLEDEQERSALFYSSPFLTDAVRQYIQQLPSLPTSANHN
jgi:hypothetical protein